MGITMARILIASQHDSPKRLPAIASAVARGARTVRTAELRLCPLESVAIDHLRWCDGLVVGVHADPQRVVAALDLWQQSLEPYFWEAVQGKFASIFVSSPAESGKRARALGCTGRMLTTHGMLVTEFFGLQGNAAAGADCPRGHFNGEYERLGRLFTGMVHAWIDRPGNPDRKRILGSLVRATRRVPALRPGAVGTDLG